MKKTKGTVGKAKGAVLPVETLVYIDAIEGTHARLLLGVEAFDVPARLLPSSAIEGTWLRLSLTEAAAPADDGEAMRAKLVGNDDGGDIKL